MTIPVNIIGWRVLRDEPHELRPQFTNPVAVRVFAGDGAVGPMSAELNWNGSVLQATIALPPLSDAPVRAFCMTDVEHEPVSGIRRRRITSIDVKVE